MHKRMLKTLLPNEVLDNSLFRTFGVQLDLFVWLGKVRLLFLPKAEKILPFHFGMS